MLFRLTVAIFCISFAIDLAALAHDPSWAMIPAFLVGWAVVDLGSGLVHMLLDFVALPPRLRMDLLYFAQQRDTEAYRTLRRSILGGVGPFWRIAYNFKYHHPRPNALGRRSMKELCADTLHFAALPLSLGLNLTIFLGPPPSWVTAATVAMVIGTLFIQYFHSTLHRPRPPAFVAVLRRFRLLMTPEAHQLHHHVQDNSFAIINGWSNPLLDRVFVQLRRRGVCREENLEPPRSDATRDLETARQRNIALPDPRT